MSIYIYIVLDMDFYYVVLNFTINIVVTCCHYPKISKLCIGFACDPLNDHVIRASDTVLHLVM